MERDKWSINPEIGSEASASDTDKEKSDKNTGKSSKKTDSPFSWREPVEKPEKAWFEKKEDKGEKPKEVKEIPDELKDIAKDNLKHKAEELEENLKALPPASEAYVEDRVDLELVNAIAEKIDDPAKEFEPAVEEAYDEIVEEMQELFPDMEFETVESRDETAEVDVLESEESTEEAADAPATPIVTPPTPPAPPTPPTTPGSTSGGIVPPTPPTPPIPPTPPLPPAGGARPPFGGGPGIPIPELTPDAPTSTAEASPEEDEDYRDRRHAAQVIAAGVIGYMIGRRGGRKRTEAKLEPQIKNLEKQAETNQRLVEDKERQIRNLAREAVAPRRPEIIVPVPVSRPEKPVEITQPIPETVPAEQTIEAIPVPVPIKASHPEKAPQVIAEKLTTPELLEAASSITIEGVSVRRLYETNQIDRGGLLYIVREVLNGGEAKKAFAHVELGRERQHERAQEFKHDPAYKHQVIDEEHRRELAVLTEAIAAKVLPSSATTTSEDPQAVAEKQAKSVMDQAHKARTAGIAATAVIGIGLALFLIWYLFNL
jgi:hypothetical protein